MKLGTRQVDEATEHLTRFSRAVDTGRVGEPTVLAVVTATGYGYTRAEDGIVVIPVTAFGP